MAEYNKNPTGWPQPPGDYRGGIVQSPEINKSGEPTQRSIRDADMARDVCRTITQANQNRSIVNSRILAKANAERPNDGVKLESEGLGWKSNFSTKPMPTLIEKIAPRFVQAINGLKYFTDSSLSDKWDNSTEKTETFRNEITTTIRNHRGWKTFLENIAFNNTLFGYTCAARLDPFSCWPVTFAQDEFFLPDGTKSESRLCQVAVLKEVVLPHELFDQIKDPDIAREVGFNLENARQAINEASPSQIRERLNVGGTLEFWYQNAIRELTLGASYMAGASVISIYNLLVQEVTGKVTHYKLAGPQMLEIFIKEDQFESMEDCLSFFSYQKGNGTMHGSKGIGRDLYELCGMIDRTRNEVIDRAILSGKIIVQGDIRNLHKLKMSLIGMMAIVPSGWTFLEQKVDGAIEPFLKLDAYFGMIADQLVGNTSPPNPQGIGEGMRSPAAWNLLASREEESKDFRISRFMEQFADMISSMQRWLCDPDVRDDEAKAMQERLLKKMTRKEIDELCKKPVASTVVDLTPLQRQQISAVASEKRGNPLYNQKQLEVEDLTARIGADFAKKVLLPDNDPAQTAEQLREQQMELTILTAGQPVPVSPRDNHLIHLQVLLPIAEQMAQALLQGDTHTQAFEAVAAHINEHVTTAQGQGAPKEALAPALDFVKKIGPVLAKLKELDAQAAQLQQESAAHDAEVMEQSAQ